jgi:hypothetical protein
MLHYLESPGVRWLCTQPNAYSTITPIKNILLKRLLPDLTLRDKQTGYENLVAFLHETKLELASILPENVGDSDPYMTYNELITTLRGNK